MTGARTSPQRALTTQETKAFQSVRQELRKDFDSVGDSLDSLRLVKWKLFAYLSNIGAVSAVRAVLL